jgi:DMSO reductase family type II enzyme heme b subunit
MKQTVPMMAAPVGMVPGGYVARAYADRLLPNTKSATLEAQREGTGWRVRLSWSCPDPVRDASEHTDRFVDAAALLVPTVEDAPWISMGAPGKAVQAALWRADREVLLQIRAEGLGTVKRGPAPDRWKVKADWQEGIWSVSYELAPWPSLERRGQLAFAIWRGAAADRAGLKSTSTGLIALEQ